ncbi:hypothetical protein SK854_36460 [Lentzea sp. BCCO 10_0061]|uniref:META domain-containing protein n=1 Tax=Lentzea sokolovensis TaxID=3095429 RepID=A0ABU4V785_9PSEU|nr:hypothetical protein [Lentzea sp. BCCO 10_0061]MDX8147651.1 hypothetical protein [Lentzea sp. BCCO 10_0061]
MLKTRLAAGVTALAATAGMVFGAAPSAAAADYPYADIEMSHLKFGATYVTGRVTFYNRSASVVGTGHFVGCRTLYAWAIDKQPGDKEVALDVGSTSPQCDKDHPINIPLEANIAGGADRVILELRDGAGKPFPTRVFMRYDLR